MILENFSESSRMDFSSDDHLQYMDDVVGDPTELQEFTNECVADVHNLTVALARFEHHCIVESAGEVALNEGIKEFFIGVKDKIVKYWNQFKAWLMHLVERIRSAIFGPRKAWLSDKREELLKATYKKGTKVNIYSLMKKDAPNTMLASMQQGKTLGESLAKKYATDSSKTIDTLKEELGAVILKGKKKTETTMAFLERAYLGKEVEVSLDSSLVKRLIDIADMCFQVAEALPGLQKVADGMIQIAQSITSPKDNDDAAEKSERHRFAEALNAIGPIVSQGISASIALNSKYNAKAMSALATAYANRVSPIKEDSSMLLGGSVLTGYLS